MAGRKWSGERRGRSPCSPSPRHARADRDQGRIRDSRRRRNGERVHGWTVDLAVSPASAADLPQRRRRASRAIAPLTVSNRGTLPFAVRRHQHRDERRRPHSRDDWKLTIEAGVATCAVEGFATGGTVLYGPTRLAEREGDRRSSETPLRARGRRSGPGRGGSEVLCLRVVLPCGTGTLPRCVGFRHVQARRRNPCDDRRTASVAIIRRGERDERRRGTTCPDRGAAPRRADARGDRVLARRIAGRVRAAFHRGRRGVVRAERPLSDRGRGLARAAHERGVERPDAGLVAGWFAAGVPLRPDHAGAPAPVHDGSRRRARARRHVRGLGGIGGVVERRRAAAGPGGRPGLLRVGLERSGRERCRPGARPRRPAPGRGAPATVHARSHDGRRVGGGAAGHRRVGGRLGRGCDGGRDRIRQPARGVGVVQRRRRSPGPGRAHRSHPVRADVADRVVVALARRHASRVHGRVRERPRTAERQRDDGQPG